MFTVIIVNIITCTIYMKQCSTENIYRDTAASSKVIAFMAHVMQSIKLNLFTANSKKHQ